jgi:hypothetical protein
VTENAIVVKLKLGGTNFTMVFVGTVSLDGSTAVWLPSVTAHGETISPPQGSC